MFSEEEVRKAIQLARETYLFMDDIIELHSEEEIIQSLHPKETVEPMQFLANQAQELKMGYEPTEEVEQFGNGKPTELAWAKNNKFCFIPCSKLIIKAGNCRCYNERPFEPFTLHPESSNPTTKEGKEESVNYVARVYEKHFWGLVETTATGQEPKTNIQCLYCGTSKENGFEHTEPNQTEAEKEVGAEYPIREIARELINKEYSFFTEDTRGKMILAFCQGYSLARKQVIEDIEGWVNTTCPKALWAKQLLTKLQTLKK
jgi:hypothetical protein